jgi:hypothetical protein
MPGNRKRDLCTPGDFVIKDAAGGLVGHEPFTLVKEMGSGGIAFCGKEDCLPVPFVVLPVFFLI